MQNESTMSEKNTLPFKERMKIPRTHMPELDPQVRSRNFEEVNLGLTAADALTEATRCIDCAKPGCVVDCPVGVKIKEVVALIYAGDYLAAAAKMREDNALPAITGRVCPQENQCEGGCVLGKKGASVAIGNLERFIADYERTSGQLGLPAIAPPTGKSVAIVGSGPAGLSRRRRPGPEGPSRPRLRGAARTRRRARLRHSRVPPAQVDRQRRSRQPAPHGRRVRNQRRGRQERNHRRADAATKHYDAVFVATGAGLPRFLGVPGEHLNGVYSANEFLTRVNLMRAYQLTEYDEPVYDCRDRDVIVVGGGNTAMDAVRTARRLGARTATLVYRRSEAEMPARLEEVHHARAGRHRVPHADQPRRIHRRRKGLAHRRALRPHGTGRARCRAAAAARRDQRLGVHSARQRGHHRRRHHANPLIQSTTPDLKTTSRNYIVADPETTRTSKRGVFAGGDIVTGGATVILAMGAGRKAAKGIDEYLRSGEWA